MSEILAAVDKKMSEYRELLHTTKVSKYSWAILFQWWENEIACRGHTKASSACRDAVEISRRTAFSLSC